MTQFVTMDAWIFPTGPGADEGGVIAGREGEYLLIRFQDGTIRWSFANQNPGWDWNNTGYIAPLNEWTHIAVVYDSGVITAYANGVQVHQYIGSGSIGDVYPQYNEFRIGGREANGGFGTD